MTASSNAVPGVTFLKDYRAPDYQIEETQLTVAIYPDHTRVSSRLTIRPVNPAVPLVLQGENLKTLGIRLDGRLLAEHEYSLTDTQLTIAGIAALCHVDIEVDIDPAANTALEGLYKSRTMYCTQCEAEGFRKITWYLDRPDVMSVFTTRIEADLAQCPVLLSNGNRIDAGELPDNRHYAVWHDPFKKPSYLFALVAGDLACVEDRYTTGSGRSVAIEVFVEPKDLDKCAHAIDSLKRAMAWDEQTYGLEYDLDSYMIVAVDDFNMGAMENKGLNIFNTSCVLAHPETTTDLAFQRVEGVVAHEYFHNWSGNRVTCRDWFQLSLKEGFTVYRDAEFSADMNSRAVKRIEDVNLLRSAQFAEDAGPLAHPVRPASYMEISNFYTLTVYEKGAEVVRMLANLLGPVLFRAGTDLYFARHDGQAVTCDDFVAAMEAVSGRDLSQFKLWYSQAGTPRVKVSMAYDEDARRCTLHFEQSCPVTPDSDVKLPMHIPVSMGLLGEAGELALYCQALPTQEQADNTQCVIELTQAHQSYVFEQVPERPVPSLLRGFSAPVHLQYNYSAEDLVRLLTADSDLFNRWNASQELALMAIGRQLGQPGQALPGAWLQALADNIGNDQLDPAVLAYMLQMPAVDLLQDRFPEADILALYDARKQIEIALSQQLRQPLQDRLTAYLAPAQYAPDAAQIAGRSLHNTLAALLIKGGWSQSARWIEQQFRQATNMTDQLAALRASLLLPEPALSAQCLADFYAQWADEALVVNQWLSVQALDERGDALARLQALTAHPAFCWTNPNKVRALIGVFANQNPVQFHRDDQAGYRWLAQAVIRLNQQNPQLASRLATPLTRWRQFGARGAAMQAALLQISKESLSKDVYEVVNKALA